MLDPIIAIENITKVYNGKVKALDNVNLEIYRGEIFSLLGPNGAGKTTLIKILVGSIKPTSGKIRIFGKEMDEVLNSDDKTKISYVPQENIFWEELTVEENMNFVARLYGLPKDVAAKRIGDLLKSFNLVEHKKKRAENLSGGLKRKLSVAMSLLNDPEILILDEPTAGLDLMARAELLADLEVLKERGKTVLITTHIIEEAERLANRVAIIDAGKIIRVDESDKLKEDVCGKKLLDLLVNGGFRGNIEEELEKILDDLEYVRVGERILVKLGDESGIEILETLEKKELVLSATIRKPTLEDAFLFLTGKKLE